MLNTPAKKSKGDETRLGDYAAIQPLSGIAYVDATAAVNGNGHGGFVRKEEAEKQSKRR